MELLKLAGRCFKVSYSFNVHANELVQHPNPITIIFERQYSCEVFMHWKVTLLSHANNVLSITSIADCEAMTPDEFRALHVATQMVNLLPI